MHSGKRTISTTIYKYFHTPSLQFFNLLDIMAESVKSEKPTVICDLEGEDFFERFSLKRVKVLGKGMAGEVFLVKAKNGSGRMLAVKKFSFSEDVRERSMRQFSTEAGVMQAVPHHHLVPCIVAARCHEYAAIAMPYYARGDLVELCGRQDPRRVNRYMSHVARAVEHLHKHNIAHNDIKLENVFVDRSDRAVLGDLGLALNVKDGSKTALAGLVGGTRDYWSPEISEADTHTRIDPFKCDVYAIGVMYWALVSGEDPEADTDFMGRLRAAQDLDLSPSQRSTLERLLEPNPVERPTASEIVKMMQMK
ncbi:hypothetical protein RRG08_033592 [Elysia crispata]|uniref:Protein kinase domain-containing protein n=1 Tax=Elysia crispata TaxID=231223 RepID=A0AAE0XP86_9GAST|nr:hypothetical protein RRG08_033592 [Elysia crispata]